MVKRYELELVDAVIRIANQFERLNDNLEDLLDDDESFYDQMLREIADERGITVDELKEQYGLNDDDDDP